MPDELAMSQVQSRGPAGVLRLSGRLEAPSAQALMQRCRDAKDQHKHLVIDLSEVSFIASSGIGTLLAVTEEYKADGGAVHLVALSEAVASVIGLMNLDRFLAIAPSEDAAIEVLGG